MLLVISNTFMTFAWYGHLKFGEMRGFKDLGLWAVILISWGIALFEYCFGSNINGGPFSLIQLKVIQEVVSLTVFTIFTIVLFKTETFRLNHIIGFGFLILAVYFIFKK